LTAELPDTTAPTPPAAAVIAESPNVAEAPVADAAEPPLPDPSLADPPSVAAVPVESPASEMVLADETRTEAEPVEAPFAPPDPEEVLLDRLRRCERRIGYEFRNKGLAREALTHASGAEHRLASNERLEFLGDAILGAVVCELLFERYPHYLEGDLTKIKSAVVSRQSCAKISEALGLQEFLIVGKGVACSPSIPPSLLADVFESLVAAIYLDGGNEASHKFIEELLGPEIELAALGELGGNFKSLLQQYAQREFSITPTYQLLDEKGPDHRKCFKMAAQIGSNLYPPAWGRNKKEAEQRAACNALAELNGEPAQFPAD
jgi:ribonuclease III